jgi:hypothetical protein
MLNESLINVFFAGAAFGAASVALNGRKLSALAPVLVLFMVALFVTGGYSTWLGFDFMPFLIPWVATSLLGSISGGFALIATSPEGIATARRWIARATSKPTALLPTP